MAKDETTINTGGGAAVDNGVRTGGDFVGRDQFNFFVALDGAKLNEFLTKSKVSDATLQQWRDFDWPKAEQAYLDKVVKLYDRVRVLGAAADVPLGNLFTQVYILDKPTARQRHDLDELRQQRAERVDFQRQPGQRTPGIQLVQKGQNLFILGKPGAGKTTFLKYITIQAAAGQLPRIPIFVSLNYWADSPWGKGDKAALLPFLVEQFAICNFPDAEQFISYLLQEGRALVLFDGLDEVKQEQDQRRRLTRLLQEFARKYDKSQHLITCRIAASDYAFADFVDVEVADFTSEQVREYAHNWFGEQEKKFETFISDLAKPENQGLAELCNTPLLLSLLCLTFDNNMRFPPSRAELYEDALETLLRKWDATREIQRDEIYRELSYKRKLQLLMRIAAPRFEKGEIFFRQRDLEQWIVDYIVTLPGAPPSDSLDGTALLKAIEAQHSVLVERAQGIYSFSHLTLQEYLTARYVAENQDSGARDRLIRNHLTDPRWREVFLLTATLLDDADDFVAALRHASDDLLANWPTVRQFLVCAYDRTQSANARVERRNAVQLAYIFLAISPSTGWASDLAGALDCDLARILDGDLSRPSAHVFAAAEPISLTFLHLFDFLLTHARALARVTTPVVGLDYGLYYLCVISSIFAQMQTNEIVEERHVALEQLPRMATTVASMATEAGCAEAVHAIQSPPTPSDSAENWQQYADALSTIIRDKRRLRGGEDFTDKDYYALNDYLHAKELLAQCLKIAVVSDRQALLDGLLAPPPAWQGESTNP